MNAQDFARLVWRMRKAQKDYYASKGERSSLGQQRLLKQAKELERLVDQALEQMGREASQIGLGI